MKRFILFSLSLLVISPAFFAFTTVKNINRVRFITTRVSDNPERLVLKGNLAAFNAAYGRNYFELNWKAPAGNFDHFEIERSLDGEKYDKIGVVNDKDVITTTGQFIFRDHFKTVTALNNDFYYRLKQIETDGNTVYSKVLIARMYNTKSLASLSITPDPQANDILVNVQLNEDSYVVMKIMDAAGNLVLKEGEKAVFGLTTYSLAGTHNLSPGIYTLEVTVNSRERMTMKLAKG
jgi:hypothetical protein